jgi:predicted dehydrogenase
MFTIVGSGFGLYGYLPALVEGAGEHVLLPREWEAKVRARPELAGALPGIHWVDDIDSALRQATAAVIATPPKRQFEIASRCVELPGLSRLVLEKPVAATPAQAAELLARLEAAGKRCRVGYTLLHAGWYGRLAWPEASADGAQLSVDWTFMANHFAKGLDTWKRRHAEGGGVLRFFGIHLVALLAHRGYDGVRRSALAGDGPGEPERWEAVFTGAGLPDCRIRVDSRCATNRFAIAHGVPGGERPLLALQDPFERERCEGGEDRRVGVLERLLATFADDDRPYHELYSRANALWRMVEEA